MNEFKEISNVSSHNDSKVSGKDKLESTGKVELSITDKSPEIPPSVMAISNLRCPSPPPILANKTSNELPPSLSLNHQQTSSANGNLHERHLDETNNKETNDKDINGISQFIKSSLQTESPKSNSSTVSLDYLHDPPKESNHHKVPSVHAHFYVDESIRSKFNRSRSGSNATSVTSDQLNHPPTTLDSLVSKQVGSLEKLVGSSTASPKISNLYSDQNVDPRLPQDDDKIHILLGVCGALSTSKIKLIILRLFEIYGHDKITIHLILTKASEHFINNDILNYLENTKKVTIWRDNDEWLTWNTRADPVLHIELRRWADILIVCPLTANTLSKITLGLCDNLLTNVIRAWNTAYPILLAPAMVSYSYNSVTTRRQLRLIAEEMPWVEILKPVEKVVGSYGDIGMGGMMDYNEIVNKIVLKLGGYPEEEDEDDDKKIIDESLVDDDEDDEDDDDDDEDDDELKLSEKIIKS